jgi:putative methionine-R-sulfoxide reductase with GAF domain
MDTHSILDNRPSQAVPGTASPGAIFSHPASTPAGAAAASRETLRFPGDDGGKSLSEMAQRDLDATLQLLAERAQYITGASGAAIALREGKRMVCCASAGASAPELGAHLQTDSGLSAESVRTRKILHCEDAEADPRVNRGSCRELGIASVVVMPLVRGEEVYGVFELLAGRPRAFEERDFIALQRLSEMIETAVEHADAARKAGDWAARPEKETAAYPDFTRPAAPVTAVPVVAAKVIEARTGESRPEAAGPVTPIGFGKVRNCEGCGFPISEGRRLCLDCEAATPNAHLGSEAPEFFGELPDSSPGWMRSHQYLVATLLIVVATIVVVVWRF